MEVGRIFRRRRTDSPEALIDAVISQMKHRLTEARLQVLAAELTRKRLPQEQADDNLQTGLQKLESTLGELQTKRDLLISRAMDADARLAIERSLMEAGQEPADVALEMLAQRASDSEAEADAVAEIRQVSEEMRGGPDA